MSISRIEEIKLWAKSAGRCAFPDCSNDLLELPGAILGQKAHIIARSPNGPRGIYKPLGGGDTCDNLILLCAHHHELVDKAPSQFTVEKLRELKAEHEQQVERTHSLSRPWKRRWHVLHYLNLPRLAMLASTLGHQFDLQIEKSVSALSAVGFELKAIMDAVQDVFEAIEVRAIRLRSLKSFDRTYSAGLMYFSERYYSKNAVTPEAAISGSRLTGRYEQDPHIHFRWVGWKFILPLDPRWITTSTAFGDFAERGLSSEVLSGIFQIKSVDEKAKIVVASPLLLGLRLSPCIEALYGRTPTELKYDEFEDND